MVAIIGGARPDCGWGDKMGKKGCRAQADFRIGLTGPQGQFKKHQDFFCRHHAPDAVRMVYRPLVRSFRQQGQWCIVTIVDIHLELKAALKLLETPPAITSK